MFPEVSDPEICHGGCKLSEPAGEMPGSSDVDEQLNHDDVCTYLGKVDFNHTKPYA